LRAQQQGKTPQPGDAHDHAGHDHGKGDAANAEVDVHRPGMKHDFSNTAKHAKNFENPERVAWQMPDQVMELMAIEPGMTVADLGAGTGFFVPYLAKAVGPSGKVLALDVEPNMVTHLKQRAAEAGLSQVEARGVEPGDPGFAPASVDRILIVNTWHHIDDRGNYSAKLRRALEPGGSIWVVDFEKTSAKGPPAAHKLHPHEVIAELTAGGLEAEAVEETLPEQYVISARASGAQQP
jgi:ubiquinone/menaquinone biosynthesis C-methylase UbiE